MKRLGGARAFAAVMSRLLPLLDRWTDGRATRLFGYPFVWLTTTGRRSGLPRRVALLAGRDGDRVVLAGSNWGKPRPPAWALNLDANPEALVDGRPVRARRATAEEAARLWPLMERFWPAYRVYRARAGREVVLYVLEPSAESGTGSKASSP
ncbi:MAG: nitroreductase/quinone reductase family protein [Gaiellaceae bacterium]